MAQGKAGSETNIMTRKLGIVLFGIAGLALIAGARADEILERHVPAYTPDGKLRMPENYREWIYLSTGFDMSYDPAGQAADHHMFDNVFVNPESYKSFVETGKWPDKTMFVLESRGAESKGSINRSGHFQSTDVMGIEAHVKDTRIGAEGWAFFGFDGSKTAKMIPQSASCYSCHSAHGAVDTTFVQFYPTLLPIAKSHGSLSESFLKEEGKEKQSVAGAAGH